MRDVVNLVGNRVGMREIVARFILPIRERRGVPPPRGVDRGIDGDVSNMHALWAQILCEGLGEDALGGLGRREGRRSGMPRNDDVFPVTMMAPSPRPIIAGASFCTR